MPWNSRFQLYKKLTFGFYTTVTAGTLGVAGTLYVASKFSEKCEQISEELDNTLNTGFDVPEFTVELKPSDNITIPIKVYNTHLPFPLLWREKADHIHQILPGNCFNFALWTGLICTFVVMIKLYQCVTHYTDLDMKKNEEALLNQEEKDECADYPYSMLEP